MFAWFPTNPARRGAHIRFPILCLLLTPTALWADADWTDYAPVTELVPTNQMRYLVKLAVKDNPSGCKEPQVFYQDYSASGSDKMYRLLLEALLSNRKVRVYVTGRCHLHGYAEISSAGIVP